jgi:hypothetical protein
VGGLFRVSSLEESTSGDGAAGLDFGVWGLDSGFWVLCFGFWILETKRLDLRTSMGDGRDDDGECGVWYWRS